MSVSCKGINPDVCGVIPEEWRRTNEGDFTKERHASQISGQKSCQDLSTITGMEFPACLDHYRELRLILERQDIFDVYGVEFLKEIFDDYLLSLPLVDFALADDDLPDFLKAKKDYHRNKIFVWAQEALLQYARTREGYLQSPPDDPHRVFVEVAEASKKMFQRGVDTREKIVSGVVVAYKKEKVLRAYNERAKGLSSDKVRDLLLPSVPKELRLECAHLIREVFKDLPSYDPGDLDSVKAYVEAYEKAAQRARDGVKRIMEAYVQQLTHRFDTIEGLLRETVDNPDDWQVRALIQLLPEAIHDPQALLKIWRDLVWAGIYSGQVNFEDREMVRRHIIHEGYKAAELAVDSLRFDPLVMKKIREEGWWPGIQARLTAMREAVNKALHR